MLATVKIRQSGYNYRLTFEVKSQIQTQFWYYRCIYFSIHTNQCKTNILVNTCFSGWIFNSLWVVKWWLKTCESSGTCIYILMFISLPFFQEFIQLYKIILPKGLLSSKEDVTTFLESMNLNKDNYQIGITKVRGHYSLRFCKWHFTRTQY